MVRPSRLSSVSVNAKVHAPTPSHTPHASTVRGAGQHTPPASSVPTQHVPRESNRAVEGPLAHVPQGVREPEAQQRPVESNTFPAGQQAPVTSIGPTQHWPVKETRPEGQEAVALHTGPVQPAVQLHPPLKQLP